ncbi:MAG: hypothetical protein Q9170_001965 [Blastenia crenularia]
MDNPSAANSATEVNLGDIVRSIEDGTYGNDITLLASGGYNDIWLVDKPLEGEESFVIRKVKEDALLPHQVLNEVACLEFVRKRLPGVPVPRVFGYHVNGTGKEGVFIAEEFIQGERLSDVWSSYDGNTKLEIAKQIAEMIVQLGETTFSGIGGLMLDGNLAPTVEGMKLFKGRSHFHSPEYYDIGPYPSTKSYVLACYDKEITYYTNAPPCDIDGDLFQSVSLQAFIELLKSERQTIADDPNAFSNEEPFVLVHGDLHGRNILVKEGRINGIVDWEFAGSFPLSELLGGMGVDILEVEGEESEAENTAWSEKTVALAAELARDRGWDEARVALLLGEGNVDLQRVRVEMFP